MKKDQTVIENTIDFVKKQLKDAESGHDWWHIYRVWNMAKKIAENYPDTDIVVIEIASLLHDVADEKFDDFKVKSTILNNYLENITIAQNQKEQILKIIHTLSFKKSFEKNEFNSIEFQIVQDADRLDAIGAIGIARAFSYGGFKNREMYNPEIKPTEFKNSKEYQGSNSPTINHFYEKLFLLKDKMNTPEAKEIAIGRNAFMEKYMDFFLKEWAAMK